MIFLLTTFVIGITNLNSYIFNSSLLMKDKVEHVKGPFYRVQIFFSDNREEYLGIEIEPISGYTMINFSEVIEVRDEVAEDNVSIDPSACVLVYKNGTQLYVKFPRQIAEKIVLDVWESRTVSLISN